MEMVGIWWGPFHHRWFSDSMGGVWVVWRHEFHQPFCVRKSIFKCVFVNTWLKFHFTACYAVRLTVERFCKTFAAWYSERASSASCFTGTDELSAWQPFKWFISQLVLFLYVGCWLPVHLMLWLTHSFICFIVDEADSSAVSAEHKILFPLGHSRSMQCTKLFCYIANQEAKCETHAQFLAHNSKRYHRNYPRQQEARHHWVYIHRSSHVLTRYPSVQFIELYAAMVSGGG